MSVSNDTLSSCSDDPELGAKEASVAVGVLPLSATTKVAVGVVAVPVTREESGRNRKKVLVRLGVALVFLGIAFAIAVPISGCIKRRADFSGVNGVDSSEETNNYTVTREVPNVTITSTTPVTRSSSTNETSSPTRFNASLPPFDESVMTPYENCTGIREHLIAALMQLADVTLDQNVERECHWWGEAWSPGEDRSQVREKNKGQRDDSSESSFQTNNQVDGVDEADFVKSNGQLVFAAYGTELVMLDLHGNELHRVTVPRPEEQQEEDTDQASSSSFRTKPKRVPDRHRNGKRAIVGLLMDNDSKTITAITDYSPSGFRRRGPVRGGVTTAFLYQFDNEQLLDLGSVDIHGTYASARMIDAVAHVVTTSYIDTYSFKNRFRRCTEEFRNMTDVEYETKMFSIAVDYVPEYADKILEDLGITDDSSICSNVVQLSSMTSDGDDKDVDDESVVTERRLDLTNGNGVIQSFLRVASIDMSQGSLGTMQDNVGLAGAFLPTTDAEVYASHDFMVIAGNGYRRNNEIDYYSWSQYTFLMSFRLQQNGRPAVQSAVGEVQGYLLNQFSMDYHEGILRVATTNSDKWAPVDVGGGKREWQLVSESSSQVTKLQFLHGGMRQVGQLGNLGISERIFSTRFIRNRAYVVTFELKDPLYVIDMEPDTPVVLSELEVTGFSSYIHPIGENHELLLTVGQEADAETGWTTGFKISLFNVSNSSHPTEMHKYVEGDDENNGYSSSSAQWDHRAFRYLEQSQKLIVPLTVWGWDNPNNFDGFVVYDVDPEEGIMPIGNVTHGDKEVMNDDEDEFCFSSAYLPARCMVFEGNLMTFKGHAVKMSENLSALNNSWTMDLDEHRDRDTDTCYHYFGGYR